MANIIFMPEVTTHAEVSKSAGGRVIFYPTAVGTGSANVSSATAEVFRGSTSVSTPTVTINQLALGRGDQLVIPIAAGLDYGEDYRVDLSMTLSPSGDAAFSSVPFDVCFMPFGPSAVTFDAVWQRMHMLSGSLANDAQEKDVTVHELVSNYAAAARSEVDAMFRNRASADGDIRARMVFDKARLNDIELKLTIAIICEAQTSGHEDDPKLKLAEVWRKKANDAIQAMTVRYDTSDDGAADTEPTNAFRNVTMTRVRW